VAGSKTKDNATGDSPTTAGVADEVAVAAALGPSITPTAAHRNLSSQMER
jgi:hypothetical protein